MKTIGLIGGMSFESTLSYYRIINERVKDKLGGWHSAKCIIFSVDFAEIEKLQHQNKWEALTKIMVNAAQSLERANADLVLICANTMHKVAGKVQANIDIPLLHIADATAVKIQQAGISKVGLLGTKFTMEENFYKDRLKEKYQLRILVPKQAEMQIVHDVIYDELCLGKIRAVSEESFRQIINNLINEGAQAIILGCTEISLLVKQSDVAIPLFDTTTIHAESAVDFALKIQLP